MKTKIFKVFGQHSVVLRANSWLSTEGSLLIGLEGHMSCWNQKPCFTLDMHAKQAPYLLYYLPSPQTQNFNKSLARLKTYKTIQNDQVETIQLEQC